MLVWSATLWLAFAALAAGPSCPPGTVELFRDEATRVLECREIGRLTAEELGSIPPDNLAALSPADRRAVEQRRVVLAAVAELPFMPDAELAAFERRLAAEANSPASAALLRAVEAALLAVGGLMLLGLSGPFEARFPGARRGLALGVVLGLGVAGAAHLATSIPLVGAVAARVAPVSPPIGFAPGTAVAALQRGRLQHASEHLRAAKLLPDWNWTTTKDIFVRGMTEILEQPRHTFDHVLRGPSAARGFVGRFNGSDVVVFVYKSGDRIGQIATVVVPKGHQLVNWKIPPAP